MSMELLECAIRDADRSVFKSVTVSAEALRSWYGMMQPPTHRAISHDGAGHYRCRACGTAWDAGKIYQWWPVRLGWHKCKGLRQPWFQWHGIQSQAEKVERWVCQWTFHLGRLKIMFGRGPHPDAPCKYCGLHRDRHSHEKGTRFWYGRHCPGDECIYSADPWWRPKK